jgi:hypothetical protein
MLLDIIAAALLFSMGFLLRMILQIQNAKRIEKLHLAQRLDSYKGGYTDGLHLGMQKYGKHLALQHAAYIHGFAINCHKCGSIIAAFQNINQEYVTCGACKHRNPSPIAEDYHHHHA